MRICSEYSVRGGALLCVPALLTVAAAILLWQNLIPDFVARERLSATREYRRIAEEIKSGARPADLMTVREKGWRVVGKVKGERWGYAVQDGTAVVWLGDGDRVRTVRLPAEEDSRIVPVVKFAIILAVTTAVAFTALGIWIFLKMNRTRRDFVAAAAHDLETPVAALEMVLENRAAGIGTEQEAFEECERLAVRLGRLVDNLRDFIHRGRRGAPVLTDFDIVASVREAYLPFAPDYRDLLGGDVPVVVREPGRDDRTGDPAEKTFLCVRIRADETLTQQILWNLFANDLKYAAPYGPVAVFVTHDESYARISFVDEGHGLTAGEMKRIFGRYYRARSTMESGKGGFGIGLCSAREFARAMGGDLTVCANEPRGCEFILSLPLSN